MPENDGRIIVDRVWLLDGAERLHVVGDCPALTRASVEVSEIEVEPTDDLSGLEQQFGRPICGTCSRMAASRPRLVYGAESAVEALEVWEDQVVLVRKASLFTHESALVVDLTDISACDPKGPDLLQGPRVLIRYERGVRQPSGKDVGSGAIEFPFAQREERDDAVTALRELLDGRGNVSEGPGTENAAAQGRPAPMRMSAMASSGGKNSIPGLDKLRQSTDSGVGLSSLYSYNNLSSSDANTCGQAAMATIADYFGKNPYGLTANVDPRTQNQFYGFDKYHYDNDEFVGLIYKDFPPHFKLPFVMSNAATVREDFMRAFDRWGISYQEYYAGVGAGPDVQLNALKEWIGARRPALLLMDAGLLGDDPNDMHWGIAYKFSDFGLSFASWHQCLEIRWDLFWDVWHCQVLPWPNNFYWMQLWKK